MMAVSVSGNNSYTCPGLNPNAAVWTPRKAPQEEPHWPQSDSIELDYSDRDDGDLTREALTRTRSNATSNGSNGSNGHCHTAIQPMIASRLPMTLTAHTVQLS